jgi:hypothetical protein
LRVCCWKETIPLQDDECCWHNMFDNSVSDYPPKPILFTFSSEHSLCILMSSSVSRVCLCTDSIVEPDRIPLVIAWWSASLLVSDAIFTPPSLKEW